MFNGKKKALFLWSFSIAMLNYQRVDCVAKWERFRLQRGAESPARKILYRTSLLVDHPWRQRERVKVWGMDIHDP